ncbi:uncharacterized protein N7443_000445 [Penicillium atrosanguineum]|uniref:uncharacterized protein n=1 Tax=Penicillium atrosanguineum TaxID=1132637 RepID=UPI0023A71EA5|nr:uncharacterized protein N7443_000445 [Penicillium atrosanguineum]KAJ5313561.1 hypothetical protein N7443_000445 [Penicillium atrosanguineum]
MAPLLNIIFVGSLRESQDGKMRDFDAIIAATGFGMSFISQVKKTQGLRVPDVIMAGQDNLKRFLPELVRKWRGELFTAFFPFWLSAALLCSAPSAFL